MGLDAFRKGLEILKEKKDEKLIKKTKANLEKSNDKERLDIYDEVFGPSKKVK